MAEEMPTREQVAVLNLVRVAIATPDKFVRHDHSEGIPAWQARAVLAALRGAGREIVRIPAPDADDWYVLGHGAVLGPSTEAEARAQLGRLRTLPGLAPKLLRVAEEADRD